MIRILNFLFILISFAALYVSSFTRGSTSISVAISNISILIGLFYLFKLKTKIRIPKNFYLVLVFNIILFLYLFFVKDKINPLYYALTFEVSIFYWIIFYNLENSQKIIRLFIIGLPVLVSILYFFKVPSLFFIDLSPNRHYHIADIWSFTIVMFMSDNFMKIKAKHVILMVTGFIFLIISNARSSYVSLASGVIYAFNKIGSKDKNTVLVSKALLILTVILFASASLNKSVLFSRPYFLQSIDSSLEYPLGVGMGNFQKISLEYFESTKDKYSFSIYTHNLYLESLSGTGVFSIFFLIFIIKSSLEVLMCKKKNIVWAAVFLAMTVNFMIDTTYTIPGLIWMWFMVYGTFQKEENSV